MLVFLGGRVIYISSRISSGLNLLWLTAWGGWCKILFCWYPFYPPSYVPGTQMTPVLMKRLCFGGLKPQNREETGSRYIYVLVQYFNILQSTPHLGLFEKMTLQSSMRIWLENPCPGSRKHEYSWNYLSATFIDGDRNKPRIARSTRAVYLCGGGDGFPMYV